MYLSIRQLEDIQDIIDGYSENVPDILLDRVNTAALEFARLEKEAIEIVGSKESLENELRRFHLIRGKT